MVFALVLPLLLLSALLFAAATAPQAPPPWRYDRTVDGVRVETRDVTGSPFAEIRVSGASSASLERVCDAIYGKGLGNKLDGRFKRRDVLRETDTERWTYEQISVPIVSDRDYVMHVKLDQPPANGRCRVSFETTTDPGHPPVRGFVRIPAIRGSWSVTQLGGAVQISYEIFSDPGGGIPAFLARGGQRSAAVEFFKAIVGRATGTVSRRR